MKVTFLLDWTKTTEANKSYETKAATSFNISVIYYTYNFQTAWDTSACRADIYAASSDTTASLIFYSQQTVNYVLRNVYFTDQRNGVTDIHDGLYANESHLFFWIYRSSKEAFLGITQLTYTFADSTVNFISYYHRLCSDVTIMKSRRPKATSSTCSSLCSKTTAFMLNATEINEYSETTNVMIS